MLRPQIRRALIILASVVFTIALIPGLATAADTRLLWIGAPDLSVDSNGDGTPDNASILLPTRVSVPAPGKGPFATMFAVEILNGGGQNLAHTVLTINADAQSLAGLSRLTQYDPDGGDDASSSYCTASGDTITCDYGSLTAGQSRTVAVIVEVTSAFTATATEDLFFATVTTNNENGSNQQTFDATSGAFKVEAAGDNTLATFALDGVPQNLTTSGVGGGGGNLNTTVRFTSGNKELVEINEGNSEITGFYPCPSGLSCQPDYSEVTTTSGSFTSTPFFTWKLTAIVPKTYALSKGFVAHFPTQGTTYDWVLYFKDKSAACGTDIEAKILSAHQCIKSLTLDKYDKSSNLLTVEVVMDHQGGMKY